MKGLLVRGDGYQLSGHQFKCTHPWHEVLIFVKCELRETLYFKKEEKIRSNYKVYFS